MGTGRASSPFKVVQAHRKVVAYQVLDTEMDNIGALSLLEQILLNTTFTAIGGVIGALTSVLSGGDTTPVWVLLFTAGIVTVLSAGCFMLVHKKRSKIKDDIRQ